MKKCTQMYMYVYVNNYYLFALVLLFWNGLFVECSVLIGCYNFPSNNFQLAMHSGLQWAFKVLNGGGLCLVFFHSRKGKPKKSPFLLINNNRVS